MKTFKFLAWAVTLIFSAAVADVEDERVMEFVVASDSSDDPTTIRWVYDNSDIDMQSMQIGESQSIVDESGRSILITREAEGFKFDVDGKSIVVPDIGAGGAYTTLVDESDFTANFDVEIVGDHHMMSSSDGSGVTIISGKALDGTTKESIKAVLQSAGRDDEVTFIDGSSGPDGKQVRVYKKQIEIAQ